MKFEEFKKTYNVRYTYKKPIETIEKVEGTDLVIVNKDQLLAPYGFHGHITSTEIYKGCFSNRTRELTDTEIKAVKQHRKLK